MYKYVVHVKLYNHFELKEEFETIEEAKACYREYKEEYKGVKIVRVQL